MTKRDRREAAAVLRRLADAVERGDYDANVAVLAGIEGAAAALDAADGDD